MNQLQFITNELKNNGQISRNFCLRHYISRLGARIADLKASGWEFKTENRNGDYFYIVTKSPASSPHSQIKPQEARSEELEVKPDTSQSVLFNLPEAPKKKKGHWEYN